MLITAKIRDRDFPALKKITYFNTASEGISPPCVEKAFADYMAINQWQNTKGPEEHIVRMEQCRQIAAKTLGLTPEETSFCSSSSEAYNLLAITLALENKDEVIINDLDFPSGVTPWLSGRFHCTLQLWKSRNGVLEIEDLLPLLNERTRLVPISLVSFYNGYRLPWAPFSKAVRSKSPRAIISVDATQALGHCILDCHDADFILSIGHKWLLGIQGCCILGIPKNRAKELTAHVGGWYHLADPFGKDRFERALQKEGALSYSVGSPIFPSIYALDASLRYLNALGIPRIAQYRNTLLSPLFEGLLELGLKPMVPLQPDYPSGIIAFQHPKGAAVYKALVQKKIFVTYSVERFRVSLHFYNTLNEVEHFLKTLRKILAVV